jgi:hypothetical protein
MDGRRGRGSARHPMNSKQRARVQTSYNRLAVEYAGHIADELSGKPIDRQLLDRFADEVRGTGLACDLGCGLSPAIPRKSDVRR